MTIINEGDEVRIIGPENNGESVYMDVIGTVERVFADEPVTLKVKVSTFSSAYYVPASVEVVRRAHYHRGRPIGPEGLPYGVTHDYDCPPCQDIPFTASPRSETYWSS